MKSAIITGGTGMIGLSLVEYLLDIGIEVTVIVRKSSKRKALLPVHPLLKTIDCDLDNLCNLAYESSTSFDAFYHLGWEGTSATDRNNVALQNNNIIYSTDAAQLAHRLKCKSFIFAGSQAQYGRVEGLVGPTTATNPEIAYGVAKQCAEAMTRLVCNQFGIKHCSARILSIYGPNDGENTMVSSTINNLLLGNDTAFTPCQQMWDYLYCKDAAKALQLMADKGKANAIYCLGSGKAKKLECYIKTIKNIINPDAILGIGKIPYSPNQVMMLCANIDNLKSDLDFEPEYSFEEGIVETIDWWRKKLMIN